MTLQIYDEITRPQAPIYFGGGFGYDEKRNQGVLTYIRRLGYETVPPLPDPDLAEQDPRFTVIIDGIASVITRREALRIAGEPYVESLSSNYQQQRADQQANALTGQGYHDIRAIFQSADALNGLKVMHAHPGLICSAILAYPAGIVAQPRFLKASRGVFRSGWSGRAASIRTAAENFEIEQNGKRLRVGRVASNLTIAASVALSDQTSLLHDIRTHADPPGMALILGIKDWMISPERVIGSLRSPTYVDRILVTDSPHGLNGRKQELHEWLKLFPVIEESRAARKAGEISVTPLVERITFFGDVPRKRQAGILAIAESVGR